MKMLECVFEDAVITSFIEILKIVKITGAETRREIGLSEVSCSSV